MSDPELTNFGSLAIVQERQDMLRYRWLAKQFSEGNETYLPESITSKEQLDEYIDKAMIKELIDNVGVSVKR